MARSVPRLGKASPPSDPFRSPAWGWWWLVVGATMLSLDLADGAPKLRSVLVGGGFLVLGAAHVRFRRHPTLGPLVGAGLMVPMAMGYVVQPENDFEFWLGLAFLASVPINVLVALRNARKARQDALEAVFE